MRLCGGSCVQVTGSHQSSMQANLAMLRRGNTVTLKQCQRLLGLMASTIVAILLRCLYMRGIQRWVASLGLDPHHNGHHQLRISSECSLALRQWKSPDKLCCHWNHSGQESGYHICFSGGLGCHSRGENGEWKMGPSHALFPQKTICSFWQFTWL